MAVDIVHLFNEHLPGALGRNADDAKTINAKFQLIIDGAGEWFIDCTDAGPTCVAGTGADPDVTMQVTAGTSRRSTRTRKPRACSCSSRAS